MGLGHSSVPLQAGPDHKKPGLTPALPVDSVCGPLSSRLCGKKHDTRGFPPSVASVCKETQQEGENPLLVVCEWKETWQEGVNPLSSHLCVVN
jgi:hypothetical protein